MKEEFNKLNEKFDRVEEKLDDHLERLSKVETAVDYMRGYIRYIILAGIAVISYVFAAYFKSLS